MSYRVYHVEFAGLPRNHHAIFVETNEQEPGNGYTFQVTGNIQQGMTYEEVISKSPESSIEFLGKEEVGALKIDNYKDFLSICQSTPVPMRQFDGSKRLYPDQPLRRCEEWTNETVQALRASGVIDMQRPPVAIS
ncbi:MAG: hypothetical protein M1831_000072 [Alyxoria varia]|nr:MAG: hypothetical protein M1831_000072 [Alyxoria varia]